MCLLSEWLVPMMYAGFSQSLKMLESPWTTVYALENP